MDNKIVTAIKEHHDRDMTSPESYVVAAADAISAARPGARNDSLERYIERLTSLEEIALRFEGVEKCFAIQAGREVRVMVNPEEIDEYVKDIEIDRSCNIFYNPIVEGGDENATCNVNTDCNPGLMCNFRGGKGHEGNKGDTGLCIPYNEFQDNALRYRLLLIQYSKETIP